MAGLPSFCGSILGDSALDRIDLGGLGRLLAVTPNDWVNILAVRHFERIFGRAGCYQLPPHQDASGKRQQHKHLHGRILFSDTSDFRSLSQLTRDGFTPKSTKLSDNFDYTAFCQRYGESALPLFIITPDRRLNIFTAEQSANPQPKDTLISLVPEFDEPNEVDHKLEKETKIQQDM